jgi:hypothetical protein
MMLEKRYYIIYYILYRIIIDGPEVHLKSPSLENVAEKLITD